jgi:hypothetical protein
VIFEQNARGGLDWQQLRAALVQADPNKIDARSLEHRERNAQFFVDQMQARMQPAGDGANAEPLRVGIVLSGPMSLESTRSVHPIEVAASSDRKVFYIRYHAATAPTAQPTYVDPLRSGRRNVPGLPFPKPLYQEPVDSLENLVKPLQPRLFDVYSPEQFRKALSTLLDEISRM